MRKEGQINIAKKKCRQETFEQGAGRKRLMEYKQNEFRQMKSGRKIEKGKAGKQSNEKTKTRGE